MHWYCNGLSFENKDCEPLCSIAHRNGSLFDSSNKYCHQCNPTCHWFSQSCSTKRKLDRQQVMEFTVINDFDDDEQRRSCLVQYTSSIQTYNSSFRVNLVTFRCIIRKIARRRLIVWLDQTYQEHSQEQLCRHQRNGLAPLIFILLAFPRLIISFSYGCMRSVPKPFYLIWTNNVDFLCLFYHRKIRTQNFELLNSVDLRFYLMHIEKRNTLFFIVTNGPSTLSWNNLIVWLYLLLPSVWIHLRNNINKLSTESFRYTHINIEWTLEINQWIQAAKSIFLPKSTNRRWWMSHCSKIV